MHGVLTLLNLTVRTDAALEYISMRYRLSLTVGPQTYQTLRNDRPRITREELVANGLRPNLAVSQSFWHALNDQGRADPIGAAMKITATLNSAVYNRRDVRRRIEERGLSGLVRLVRSNMAAGPCPAADDFPSPIAIREAKDLPLLQCMWPDQCGCRYDWPN